jgi:hypothetical protein
MSDPLEIVRQYCYASVPTIRRFSQSRAFIRGLMGSFGSGKSSGCVIELVKLAKRRHGGAARTRRSADDTGVILMTQASANVRGENEGATQGLLRLKFPSEGFYCAPGSVGMSSGGDHGPMSAGGSRMSAALSKPASLIKRPQEERAS